MEQRSTGQAEACDCFSAPFDHRTTVQDLGMDKQYAEVAILRCTRCGQSWLRVHIEDEAFTASGRWYLGAITVEQAALATAENAKATLEELNWYFYGGSYYDGRVGRVSGKIW